MTSPDTPRTDTVTLPPLDACPECGEAWNASAVCPKCALERGEAERFRSAAVRRARTAHALLRTGNLPSAAGHLQVALSLGIPPESVARLSALISALTGEWDALRPADLPASWQNAVRPESGAMEQYQKAQEAARAGDWSGAIASAESCLSVAPWFLPAHKVRILALTADGRHEAALSACEELLAELPEEPDLLRYYREIAPQVTPAPEPVAALATIVPVVKQPREKAFPLWGWGGVVAAAGLAFAAGRLQPANPPVTPTPAPSASVASAETPTPAPTTTPATPAPPTPTPEASPSAPETPPLPPALARQEQEFLAEANTRLARRWFNAAVNSLKAGKARQARQYAEASLRYVEGTYLEEEAHFFRARAAERAKDADAAELYDAFARSYPGSVYAPVSRRASERLNATGGRTAGR